MSHLTLANRIQIQTLGEQNFSCRRIAKILNVHPSTISRELRRNCNQRSGVYVAIKAEKKAQFRQKQPRRPTKMTPSLKARVDDLLAYGYSPEQISGTLKNKGEQCVSHETIYRYIWEDRKHGNKQLYTYLRRQGRRYAKRGAKYQSRSFIKNRVCISQRPNIVEKKTRFGDLEIDTVIGKNHRGVLVTLVDRASGFLWVGKLESRSSIPLAQKVIEMLTPFKTCLHTITADNGSEFAQHQLIAQALGVSIYFAHPYHSWERGANENANGLLRQYFPKKTDLSLVNEKELAAVVESLNRRPRKRFNYLTPLQKATQLLNLKQRCV